MGVGREGRKEESYLDLIRKTSDTEILRFCFTHMAFKKFYFAMSRMSA